MVWTCSNKQAEALSKLSDELFIESVNIAIHNQYEDLLYAFNYPDKNLKLEAEWGATRFKSTDPSPPRVKSIASGSRNAFPLRLRNAEKYIEDRIVLIG